MNLFRFSAFPRAFVRLRSVGSLDATSREPLAFDVVRKSTLRATQPRGQATSSAPTKTVDHFAIGAPSCATNGKPGSDRELRKALAPTFFPSSVGARAWAHDTPYGIALSTIEGTHHVREAPSPRETRYRTMSMHRPSVLLMALVMALAVCGCGSRPSAVSTAATAPSRAASSTSDSALCSDGLRVLGTSAAVPGREYVRCPTIEPVAGGGATYACQQYASGRVTIGHLDATGHSRSSVPVELAGGFERSHLSAAVSSGRVALGTTVWRAEQNTDIELTLVDVDGRVAWTTWLDPTPMVAEVESAVAWYEDTIAVAWTRGHYPAPSGVRFATVDARDGHVRTVVDFSFQGWPQNPVVVRDGDGFALAWEDIATGPLDEESPMGVVFARASRDGSVTTPRLIARYGANPSLAPTPSGIGAVWRAKNVIVFAMLDHDGTVRLPIDTVATPLDPSAFSYGPRIAFDGARFGVAWSVEHAHAPEAYAAFIEPRGRITGPVRLEEGASPLVQAVAWSGADLLTLVGRDRRSPPLVAPSVVSARISSCQTSPVGAILP